MDNQWGLSPYNSNKNHYNYKKYQWYSAITKNSTHIWCCDSGADISVSPCPFCGKEDESLSKQEIEFFNKYLNCVYENITPRTIDDFKFIFSNSHKYLNENNLKIMDNQCKTKLATLNLKRCMGCGEILQTDTSICNCGYLLE